MKNYPHRLIEETNAVLNPDGSGVMYTPAQIRDLVSKFPPARFIGKAVPSIVSTRLGKFIWVDDKIVDLTGYTAKEFMSQSLQELLPRLHTPEHGMIIGQLFLKTVQFLQAHYSGNTAINVNVDMVLLRKDGDKKRVLSHLWPLEWDRFGNLTLWGNYHVDISHLGKGGAPSASIILNGTVVKEFHPEISSVGHLHIMNLTERETELLIMEARGMSIDEISARTNLSKATIYTHRRNLLHRSGQTSTTKLIEELRERGVI